MFVLHTAEPPRITNHPQKLKDAIPGKSAKFTVQATGTEPLNYNWQWKRDEKGSGSKEWQPCEASAEAREVEGLCTQHTSAVFLTSHFIPLYWTTHIIIIVESSF